MRLSNRVHLIASGHSGCSWTHPNDCNVYAVRCGARYVLIDAGVGVNTGALIDNLIDSGIAREQIEALLLTHAHLDHAGGARHLHNELQIPVWASLEAATALESGDEESISLTSAKRAGIYDESFRLAACPVSRRLNGGEIWELEDCSIRVIRTPGHSRDMLTYLAESQEGLLAFPGDTVFHGGRILISDTWDCDPAAYADSLRALAALPIDGLYPGHSIWSVREGRLQLQRSLEFIEKLLLPPNLL